MGGGGAGGVGGGGGISSMLGTRLRFSRRGALVPANGSSGSLASGGALRVADRVRRSVGAGMRVRTPGRRPGGGGDGGGWS